MRLRTSFEQAEAFAEPVMGLAPAQQTPEPVPVEPPPSPMPPVPHEEPEPEPEPEPPKQQVILIGAQTANGANDGHDRKAAAALPMPRCRVSMGGKRDE
jgi:hypothetical protein